MSFTGFQRRKMIAFRITLQTFQKYNDKHNIKTTHNDSKKQNFNTRKDW